MLFLVWKNHFWPLRLGRGSRSSRAMAQDPLLAPKIARRPGLEYPAHGTPSEIAVRAMLSQQISVKGASTLADRIAARFGLATASSIYPEVLADAPVEECGIVRSQTATIRALAASSLGSQRHRLTPMSSSSNSWQFPALAPGPRNILQCADQVRTVFPAGRPPSPALPPRCCNARADNVPKRGALGEPTPLSTFVARSKR